MIKKSARSLGVVLMILYIGLAVRNVSACDLGTEVRHTDVQEIKDFFATANKGVLTFIGYSGSGYQDKEAMLAVATRILDDFNPKATIVNIGATPEGIGEVYKLAKRRGFMTTGIVSTQAMKYDAVLSPCVDIVFYVKDKSWGGFIDGSERLSPTSTAMVESSTILVGIGGGSVGRDELITAKRMGKDVRFFPADMNHNVAREKARKKGLPEPINFSGAASTAF